MVSGLIHSAVVSSTSLLHLFQLDGKVRVVLYESYRHPDKNLGSAKAAERFKEIAEAMGVV